MGTRKKRIQYNGMYHDGNNDSLDLRLLTLSVTEG